MVKIKEPEVLMAFRTQTSFCGVELKSQEGQALCGRRQCCARFRLIRVTGADVNVPAGILFCVLGKEGGFAENIGSCMRLARSATPGKDVKSLAIFRSLKRTRWFFTLETSLIQKSQDTTKRVFKERTAKRRQHKRLCSTAVQHLEEVNVKG